MFAHEFIRNAYLAGTFVALAAGMVGYLVVLRAQVFAGDALSHVAFVGAVGAAVLGLDERIGLFVLTAAVALVIAGLGRRGEGDDTVIGIVFAWILGIGILLIALLATSAQGGNGVAAINALLGGSIFELGASAARLAAVIGLVVAVAIAVCFRPLLLSTLDPELAALRGIRVRALGAGLLLALAIVTAESTQAVGALLLLGLVAAPAGAAHRLTTRPYRALILAGGLAVGSVWAGLALSYAIASLPPSSAIIGVAAGCYALAALSSRRRQRRGPVSGPDGSHDPGRRRFLRLRDTQIPQRRGALRRSQTADAETMERGISSP